MNDSQEIAILIKSIAKSKKFTIKQMLSDCQMSVNTLSSMQTGGSRVLFSYINKNAKYDTFNMDWQQYIVLLNILFFQKIFFSVIFR